MHLRMESVGHLVKAEMDMFQEKCRSSSVKTIKKAKQDKNQIYAVVKSSTINHDGKTNGYTVPNPNAQAGFGIRGVREGRY